MSGTPGKNIPADEILVMLCADLEADGMLSSYQRAGLGAVLARNPRLNELYESFRVTRDPLARPFELALATPLSESLLHTVRESPSAAARPRKARKSSSLTWLAEVVR